jgi:hypothetical protein
VGLGRLELPTSPLSGARSSHLSYRPIWEATAVQYKHDSGRATNGSSTERKKRTKKASDRHARNSGIAQKITLSRVFGGCILPAVGSSYGKFQSVAALIEHAGDCL